MKALSVRQAAFIGVGAMVGAGIFSLLGAAGEVAGAAVWLSFLLAGIVAVLQGYSFGKLGAKFPTAGGLLEYVVRGFQGGHVAGVVAWLVLATNAIITGMVATSFGSYASGAVANHSDTWVKIFAVSVIVAMGGLNLAGSKAVARVQTTVVYVVIGILSVFAVVTIVNIDPHLLSFSGYPSLREVVSSVALTFFAFLGFGVITFTAKDLRDPVRELPRAMYLALGLATVVYIAVALGVFGTLSVDKVIASGGTALAVAAEPTLGDFGFWLMTVTALFSTAGATNAGFYPAAGLCEEMASIGQFPSVMAHRFGGRTGHGPHGHRFDRSRLSARIRPQLDRLDRQRNRSAGLRPGDHRPFPVVPRNRRETVTARGGAPFRRSRARDLHADDTDPRTDDADCDGGNPGS